MSRQKEIDQGVFLLEFFFLHFEYSSWSMSRISSCIRELFSVYLQLQSAGQENSVAAMLRPELVLYSTSNTICTFYKEVRKSDLDWFGKLPTEVLYIYNILQSFTYIHIHNVIYSNVTTYMKFISYMQIYTV